MEKKAGETGIIVAVCISSRKGVAKRAVEVGILAENHGLLNDAHAGTWHRQVSLLSSDRVEAFKQKGAPVIHGDFGENLLVSGLDLAYMPVGTKLSCNGALLEITQIGKECHTRCAIYHTMGECIMPAQGVFARVLRGGEVRPGDIVTVLMQTESCTRP